jgi:predicted phosphodiesterase
MKIPYGSDWHIRPSNPICRTDNYAETIIKKLMWLREITKEYGLILSGGDLFDKDLYKSPSDIVAALLLVEQHLPDMIGIVGNHSLLHRSYEYLAKSTIAVPIASGKYKHIQGFEDLDAKTRVFGFDYGTGGIKHPDKDDLIDGCNIAMMHEYVSKKENKLFGKYVAKDLLKEFPEFDIILTGDNHQTFTEKLDGRILINPGSFLRMDSDQDGFEPSIFIIDTEELSFEQVKVPIEKDVISIEHRQVEKDRDERIDSFIITMNEEYEVTDQFVKNVEKYLLKNKVNSNVEKFINMSLEDNIGA